MNATGTIIQRIEVPVVSPDYVTLLERVNGINATGLTLANTFIALLAVVLAAVGIFVAYITWRNSKEQKEERRKIYTEHTRQLQEQYQVLIATYEERMKELIERIESITEDAEGAGNGVENTKQELEQLVSDYKTKLELAREKAEAKNTTSKMNHIPMVEQRMSKSFTNTINHMNSAVDNLYEVKNCPHCGKGYKVNKYMHTRSGGFYTNTCPHCGGEV